MQVCIKRARTLRYETYLKVYDTQLIMQTITDLISRELLPRPAWLWLAKWISGVFTIGRYGTAGANYNQYKEDYVRLYIDTLRSALLIVDPTSRPFLSSSPTNGLITQDNGWISESPRPSDPRFGDGKIVIGQLFSSTLINQCRATLQPFV